MRYIINLPPLGALLVSMGEAYMIAAQGCLIAREERTLTVRPLKDSESYGCLLAWKRGQPFSRAADKFIEHAKCFLGINAPA